MQATIAAEHKTAQSPRPRRPGRGWLHAGRLVLLVIGGATFLIPFLWMVDTALKTTAETFHIPPVFLPSPIVWTNFSKGWTVLPFSHYLVNTVFLVGVNLVGTLLSSTLVAFSFSRLRWRGRDTLFFLVLSTLMLPYVVTLVPSFIIFHWLHWVNTFLPLTVPSFFATNPFNIFLLRQYFLTIPRELDEAARLDGASSWWLLARVIVPLSSPALGAVVIFSFTATWNDFVGPLIYLGKPALYTLALGLQQLQGYSPGGLVTPWNTLMAVALLVMLPCVALFFIAQRQFIQGINLSGVER